MICRKCGYNHIVKEVDHELIIKIVLDYYGVGRKEFESRDKTGRVSNVRQIICYMLRNYTKLTFLAIGKMLNRHHTAIMNSVRTVENHRETEEDYNYNIIQVMNKIDLTFLKDKVDELQKEISELA